MDALEQQVRQTAHRLNLFRKGERVVLAVSGGPDSLALLHMLHALRDVWGLSLVVAHLDHALRPSSREDAAFVGRVAAQLGLFCVRERQDVRAYAQTHRLSLEEAAREVRYRFLAQVAHATQATAIATGHTADDQAETVLMHFLRGAGLSGLKGMRARSPLVLPPREPETPANVAVDIVRPLLFTTRREIETYLERKGLHPVLDETNLDTTFYRNRLRHELLPFLEREYQPNLRVLLARSAETLGVDWDFIQQEANAAWAQLAQSSTNAITFPREAFLALHPALQRLLVRRAVFTLRPLLRDVQWEHVLNALAIAAHGETGAQATLPGHLTLRREYDAIRIERAPVVDEWPQLDEQASPPLTPDTTYTFGEWTLRLRLVPREALDTSPFENQDRWQAFLDAAHVRLPLRLRVRQQGDRFQPLGMPGDVNLADFLTAQKVPAPVRDALPLLVDADNRILWVVGVRISDEAAIREHTTHVIHVSLHKHQPETPPAT